MIIIKKTAFNMALKKKGLSQCKLAEAIEVSKQAINRAYHGRGGIGPEVAKRIAKYLKVKFEKLFEERWMY